MKVLLTGGGTGGHIYPAIAIAEAIKDKYKNSEILFVGTANGLEKDIVPKSGFELKKIKVRGFKRKLDFENILTIKEFLLSFIDVYKIIKEFKPDIVIGTGGYVSASVLLTSSLMGIPSLIHEQNAFPGLANKILSRFVDKVAVTFEEASSYFPGNKIVVTGNPIRKDFLEATKQQGLRELGFIEGLPLVLITGGSRGAKKINENALALAEYCIKTKCFQMLHMTGTTQYNSILETYRAKGIPLESKYLKIVPYLYNMPYALAASDIVISRCGAGVLAEITALGKPSILIPYPFATDNHQEYNGRALEKNGAAIVILEKDLNGEILVKEVLNLINDHKKLRELAENSYKIGKPGAVNKILELIDDMLCNK